MSYIRIWVGATVQYIYDSHASTEQRRYRRRHQLGGHVKCLLRAPAEN